MVKRKNKKGVSVIVGYVILITFGIIMGVLVYTNLKTYVPAEIMDCPDGVSLMVVNYTCGPGELQFWVKNNGRFNLEGYTIAAATDVENIATNDLSSFFVPHDDDFPDSTSSSGKPGDNSVYFYANFATVKLEPGKTHKSVFNGVDGYVVIELLPLRIQQDEDGHSKHVVCGNKLIKQEIECS